MNIYLRAIATVAVAAACAPLAAKPARLIAMDRAASPPGGPDTGA